MENQCTSSVSPDTTHCTGLQITVGRTSDIKRPTKIYQSLMKSRLCICHCKCQWFALTNRPTNLVPRVLSFPSPERTLETRSCVDNAIQWYCGMTSDLTSILSDQNGDCRTLSYHWKELFAALLLVLDNRYQLICLTKQ